MKLEDEYMIADYDLARKMGLSGPNAKVRAAGRYARKVNCTIELARAVLDYRLSLRSDTPIQGGVL